MVAYAIRIFREVEGLVPSPTTKDIISKLARHFDEEIRSTILGRLINSLEDLSELLEVRQCWTTELSPVDST